MEARARARACTKGSEREVRRVSTGRNNLDARASLTLVERSIRQFGGHASSRREAERYLGFENYRKTRTLRPACSRFDENDNEKCPAVYPSFSLAGQPDSASLELTLIANRI